MVLAEVHDGAVRAGVPDWAVHGSASQVRVEPAGSTALTADELLCTHNKVQQQPCEKRQAGLRSRLMPGNLAVRPDSQ
jgi:hypothetical protein